MHLGRFNFVIDRLNRHFQTAKLAERLGEASNLLDQHTQSRSQAHIDAFRSKFQELLDASEEVTPDLDQPFAQQVISELSLGFLFPPLFRQEVTDIASQNGFDSAALAAKLRDLATRVAETVTTISQLDSAFGKLSVEYTEVEGEAAEIGFLLPREVVGETLPQISREFDQLSKLARAICEITGGPSYDPRVGTISSSWWQVFLDITPEQIGVWVLVIERIVQLFKSNLEIKNIQNQLMERNIKQSIVDDIEADIKQRVALEIQQIAADVIKDHCAKHEQGRATELETQLRHGLRHLAVRINQGAQVEINVAVPEDPKDPEPNADEETNFGLLEENKRIRERISLLRKLRDTAQAASATTRKIECSATLLIEDSTKDAPGSEDAA